MKVRENLFPNSGMPMYSADRIAEECANLLLGDIVPQQPGERVKQWVSRAADITGLTPWYVAKLRYREVRAVPAHVMDEIRALAARQRAAAAKAEALRMENAEILALARQGALLDIGTRGGGSGVVQSSSAENSDPRQIPLPLSGWRR